MIQNIRRGALITLFLVAASHVTMYAPPARSLMSRTGRFLRKNAGSLTILATLAAIAAGYYYDQDLREQKQDKHFGRMHTATEHLKKSAHGLGESLKSGVAKLSSGQKDIKKEVTVARELVMAELAEHKAREKALADALTTGLDTLESGQTDLVETLALHEAAAIARDGQARKFLDDHFGGLLARHDDAAAAREAIENQLAQVAKLEAQVNKIADVTIPTREDADLALESARQQLRQIQAQKATVQMQAGMDGSFGAMAQDILARLDTQERILKHQIARAQAWGREQGYTFSQPAAVKKSYTPKKATKQQFF